MAKRQAPAPENLFIALLANDPAFQPLRREFLALFPDNQDFASKLFVFLVVRTTVAPTQRALQMAFMSSEHFNRVQELGKTESVCRLLPRLVSLFLQRMMAFMPSIMKS
jgi:hypothetical protein